MNPAQRQAAIMMIVVIIVAVLLIALSGCQSYDNKRGRGDAPVGAIDDAPAEIVNMPDQYSNLATKCVHGHRIIAATDNTDRINTVIPNDPTCPRS